MARQRLMRVKKMNNTPKEVADFLAKQNWVSIFAHVNPDGDAIGSTCALALALEKLGVRVDMYNTYPIPKVYHFLANAEKIRLFTGEEELAPVVIVVDSANLKRTDLDKYPEKLAGRILVDIDHHLGNEGFGDYNFVQDSSVANCENIYQVLKEMPIEIDEEIATALYLGISTDSGSFKFDAVTAKTHRIAAELLEKGARVDLVRLYIYESVSPAKLTLEKYLYNNLHIALAGKIAWCAFDKKILAETKADGNDIDGIVNIMKNIEGVELAILFREWEDGVKVSFRSKQWLNANDLATYFGGGGHKYASGATINKSLEESIALVVAKAEEIVGERV